MTTIVPVVLCGGRGQRLWPLSRVSAPKQFLPLLDGKTPLGDALERAEAVRRGANTVCVTAAGYIDKVRHIASTSDTKVDLVVEPEPKGTAASVLAAACWVRERYGEAVLAIMPSDHRVSSLELFKKACETAVFLADQGRWVVLGTEATKVDPAFGHIKKGALLEAPDEAFLVSSFFEKPQRGQIDRFCEEDWLWHAGIGFVSAARAISVFEALDKQFYDGCHSAVASARQCDRSHFLDADGFASLGARGLDRTVYEAIDDLAVVPLKGEWSDLGTWREIEKLTCHDVEGNCGTGRFFTAGSNNTYIRSNHKLTVALGVDGLAIIDTPDALLVARKDALGELSDVVNGLEKDFKAEVHMPSSEARPWGSFDALLQAHDYKVKLIRVNPGEKLSLQYHDRRSEHWVVVKGVATVTCQDEETEIGVDESFSIPRGAVHRLENRHSGVLELVEVQVGKRPCEHDIVRLEDEYQRAP